jgi:tetratricopeptide (TPR) repeat protein
MNRFTKILSSSILVIAAAALGRGQPAADRAPGIAPKSTPVPKATPFPVKPDHPASVRLQAKSLVRAGNIPAAEKLLTDQNKYRISTPEWRMESAQRLIGLASEVSREGSPAAARQLADSALQHYNQAAAVAKTDKKRAAAKAGSGYIYERFKGDPMAALAAYQAAHQLNPSDVAIREAAQRLTNADAKLRARIQAAKR